ncbi:MAG TPA: hypothetical protein PKO18_09620, partial [Chitinophagales bacterium]|nr:hypothetical protein [Chitinophagales bacterium]
GLQLSEVLPLIPKLQKQLSGLPDEVFVKFTNNGEQPLSLLRVKSAFSCAITGNDKNIEPIINKRLTNIVIHLEPIPISACRGNMKNMIHGFLC